MSGGVTTCQGEKLFMVQFNFQTITFRYISRRSSDSWFQHCSGSISSVRRSTRTRRKHVVRCVIRRRDRVPLHVSVSVNNDQQLREAAGRWGVWVRLSRSVGVGDACCCEKARGRCDGRRKSNRDIYDRSNTYRGEGVVTSAARQHRVTAGIEQGRHVALLSVHLDGGW